MVCVAGVSMQLHSVDRKLPPLEVQLAQVEQVPVQVLLAVVVVVDGGLVVGVVTLVVVVFFVCRRARRRCAAAVTVLVGSG